MAAKSDSREDESTQSDISDCWFDSDKLTNVNFNRKCSLVAVDYPGVVINVDKALATLGGCEALSRTFCQKNNRAALRWHPDNLYCKPAYAERYNTTNLLMKVKKRWKKGDNSGSKCQYKVEILGHIGTTYKFQAIADYQYLPMVKQKDGAYKGILEDLKIGGMCERREYLDKDIPLFLPPSTFSRNDYPDREYLYRSSVKNKPGYTNPDVNRPQNIIGKVRQKRSNFTMFRNFCDDVPQEASNETIQSLYSRYNCKEEEDKLKQLFEERPIWSKLALKYHFRAGKDRLKFLLPLVAFYYLNGPWRCLWVRFGYDPRKHPEAKIYQTVDFRKRQETVGDKTGIKLKRGENVLQFPVMRRNINNDIKINIKSIQAMEDDKEQVAETLTEEETSFIYTPDTIPPCRQMFYQLCDIRAPKLEEIIKKNDGKETECDDKDGWCILGTIEKCRDLMSFYTMKLLHSDDSITLEQVISRKKHHMRKGKRIKRISKIEEEESSTSSAGSFSSDEGEGQESAAAGHVTEEDDVNEMETEILDCV